MSFRVASIGSAFYPRSLAKDAVGPTGGVDFSFVKDRTTEQTYPNGTRTAQIRAHTAPSNRYTNHSPRSPITNNTRQRARRRRGPPGGVHRGRGDDGRREGFIHKGQDNRTNIPKRDGRFSSHGCPVTMLRAERRAFATMYDQREMFSPRMLAAHLHWHMHTCTLAHHAHALQHKHSRMTRLTDTQLPAINAGFHE